MQENLSQHYTLSSVESRNLALIWFKKVYPNLNLIDESDLEAVAYDIYDVCKNLIGTESTSAGGPGFGGSHGEIRAAVAAGMGIAIEYDDEEIRHFNTNTVNSLREAWVMNDHESFMARCAGYERNATNAKIDLLPMAQEMEEGIYEMLEDENAEEIFDDIIDDFVKVMTEYVPKKRHIQGNRHKRRMSKKPPKKFQKLFEFDSAVER